jgi:glycerate kinase
MKFICAPDSFKGSIRSTDAAHAMADGILRVLPEATVDCCPVGDGGEGTLVALQQALGGRIEIIRAHGAQGELVDAPVGRFDDFAYVESATVIGLTESTEVMSASTQGVGELIAALAGDRPGRILVGVGGSATTDGGCGMAQALGVRFFDKADRPIERPIAGGTLGDIARIDPSGRLPALDDVELVVLCDVTNPFCGPEGAAVVYGPQKGATAAEVELLDDGLKNLAALIRRDVGTDIERLPGAGAAGGLGGGLMAFAGANAVPGIQRILAAVDFDKRLDGVTLCLTGEGRIDAQSVSGKASVGVAGAAAARGVPTIALVGATGPGAEQCLAAGIERFVVIGEGLPAAESMQRAGELLAAAAAEIVAERY